MSSSKNTSIVRSGLGREFSFRYPAHRLIAGITLAVGVLAGLLSLLAGEGLMAAVFSGLNSGGAAFVAWVLARELDPPRPWTGWLAALVAGGSAIAWGPVAFAGSVLMLLLLRLVNRAAGLRLVRADRSVLLLGAVLALLVSGNGWLGIAAALAFILDAVFTDRAENLAFAALAWSAALVTWWRSDWPAWQTPEPPILWAAGITLTFFLIWLWRLPRRDLGPDDRGGDFNRRRLLAAVVLALGISLLTTFGSSTGGLDLLPLWVALLAALLPA